MHVLSTQTHGPGESLVGVGFLAAVALGPLEVTTCCVLPWLVSWCLPCLLGPPATLCCVVVLNAIYFSSS